MYLGTNKNNRQRQEPLFALDTRKKIQIIKFISEWPRGVTIGVTVEPGSQLRYYLINTELKVGWLNLYEMRS